jgi:hypothetical protein
MQSSPKGKTRKISVYWQAVSPQEVLTNKRYKILGTPLTDWLVCSQCNRQQRHHAKNGGDFDAQCWECGADSSSFLYMDELARELLPSGENLYRLKR